MFTYNKTQYIEYQFQSSHGYKPAIQIINTYVYMTFDTCTFGS